MRLIAFIATLCLLSTETSYALNVRIMGRWQGGPEVVHLMYMEDATTAKYVNFKSVIDPATHRFEFNIDIQRPVILQIQNHFVIARPGDTMDVHVTGSEDDAILRFEGPQRMEHSFLIRLKDTLGLFPVSRYTIDERSMEKYKVAATHHYDSCLLFLQGEVAEQLVTKEFEKVAQGYLTARYYSDLMYPVQTKRIAREKLPKYYFELVDFSFFKKTDFLGFREFMLAVAAYNANYYADLSTKQYYDSVSVAARIKSANRHFFGEVKDNLLLYIFSNLMQKGTDANAAEIQTLYEYLTGAFSLEPKRLEQLLEMKHEFDIVNKPLPQSVLAQQLKTHKGKTISLKEILANSEVVYVDFWASWCGPCMSEMPSERQLMTEFEGKPVKFIFISFDDDEKKWQKAITKLKLKGGHYLLGEGFTSELAKYISFNEIPRYLILDKQGRLRSREAPRPSSILQDKSVLLGLLD